MLQKLSLINKVASELSRHIDEDDKDLAEFIVSLGEENRDFNKFKGALAAAGADFPAPLQKSIHELIQRMSPSRGPETSASSTSSVPKSAGSEKFSGLAKPNTAPLPVVTEEEMKEYRERVKSSSSSSMTMSPPSTVPEIYKIYDGRITSTQEMGCFVEILGFTKRYEGLCHVQNMTGAKGRSNAREMVKRGQPCKVKVLSMVGEKITLSMNDVDQATGKDLRPLVLTKKEDVMAAPPKRQFDDDDSGRRSKRKHVSGQELWEMSQLIKSGTVRGLDRPDVDEDGETFQMEETEEEIEIELNEEEPPFLRGQTAQSLDLSPVKVQHLVFCSSSFSIRL